MEPEKKKRGFAAITPERLREIASQGGVARKKAFDQAQQRRQGPVASRLLAPSSANDLHWTSPAPSQAQPQHDTQPRM